MRRLWFPLLMALLLAACSSAPQRSARTGESSSSGAFRTRPPGFPNFVDHSIGREEIPIQAMSLVGIPYRWGGNTPDSGFDCSGLVRYVFARSASVNLPRTTAEMSTRGESIDPDEIATGDLVFFNTTGRPHSHVGIYVGKLRFVNAPSTGGTVRLDYLNNPYWAKHFDGIRRVAPPKTTPAPFDVPTYQASRTPEGANGAAGAAGSAAGPAGAKAGYAAGNASSYAATPAQAPIQAQTPISTPAGARPADARAAMAAQTSVAPVASGLSGATATPNGVTGGIAPTNPPPATADAFEPPPSAMSAAQLQARDAGAVSPAASSGTTAPTIPATPASPPSPTIDAREMQQQQQPPVAPARTAALAPSYGSAPATPSNTHPDAIDQAADAYEPPPPSATTAQQQARSAQQLQPQPSPPAAGTEGTQIMRASTASHGQPIRTPAGDDPIARFANGSF